MVMDMEILMPGALPSPSSAAAPPPTPLALMVQHPTSPTRRPLRHALQESKRVDAVVKAAAVDVQRLLDRQELHKNTLAASKKVSKILEPDTEEEDSEVALGGQGSSSGASTAATASACESSDSETGGRRTPDSDSVPEEDLDTLASDVSQEREESGSVNTERTAGLSRLMRPTKVVAPGRKRLPFVRDERLDMRCGLLRRIPTVGGQTRFVLSERTPRRPSYI